MIFRCSSLAKLMTNPKSKSESLSAGAKTYIKELAKQNFYGYTNKVETKQMRKGTEYEPESIALLNSVWFGSNFVKNTHQRQHQHISLAFQISSLMRQSLTSRHLGHLRHFQLWRRMLIPMSGK
jgi:hypothetical protein